MGFFSKTCAKTHLPAITMYKEGFPSLTEVVALLPDGRTFRGTYDGYGGVGGIRLLDEMEKITKFSNDFDRHDYGWGKIKFVLAQYYAGETYDQIGESGSELAQGYFMDDKFLRYCVKHGPFKSRKQYEQAFQKYANW